MLKATKREVDVDVEGDDDDDSIDDKGDLVPSSASPPWKFGQVY